MKSLTKNGVILRNRRIKVVKRLEKQLQSGLKPLKGGGMTELSEHDKNRITKELEILKTKI